MAETTLLDCLLFLLILAVLAFYYLTFLKTAKNNAPLLPSNFSTSCAYSSPQGTNKEKMKTYFSAMSMVFIPGFLITTSTDMLGWVKDAPSAGAMLLVLSISMVWGAVSLVMLLLGSHGRRIQDHEIVGDGPACLNASPSIANFAGSGADTSADPVTLA